MNPEKLECSSREIEMFLLNYSNEVFEQAMALRNILIQLLPGIKEQLDLPAKMIAYCYGQKYADLVCVLMPSKKGLKLGFNRGVELPDPESWLQGKGKISRYVEISSERQVNSGVLRNLVSEALVLYQKRTNNRDLKI